MTADFLEEKRRTAREVADQILGERTDLIGIMIVGSVAQGDARPDSDIDLIVFTRKNRCTDLKSVLFKGNEVDITYVPWDIICWELKNPSIRYDTHGGEFSTAIILYDPEDKLGELKERLKTYPLKLRKKVFDAHFGYASSSLEGAEAALRRGDMDKAVPLLYLAALFAWCALYPLNNSYRRYWMPDLSRTKDFNQKPSRFEQRFSKVMGFPLKEEELLRRVELMYNLIQHTKETASEELGFDWKDQASWRAL